jgi:hypothetical protein
MLSATARWTPRAEAAAAGAAALEATGLEATGLEATRLEPAAPCRRPRVALVEVARWTVAVELAWAAIEVARRTIAIEITWPPIEVAWAAIEVAFAWTALEIAWRKATRRAPIIVGPRRALLVGLRLARATPRPRRWTPAATAERRIARVLGRFEVPAQGGRRGTRDDFGQRGVVELTGLRRGASLRQLGAHAPPQLSLDGRRRAWRRSIRPG